MTTIIHNQRELIALHDVAIAALVGLFGECPEDAYEPECLCCRMSAVVRELRAFRADAVADQRAVDLDTAKGDLTAIRLTIAAVRAAIGEPTTADGKRELDKLLRDEQELMREIAALEERGELGPA